MRVTPLALALCLCLPAGRLAAERDQQPAAEPEPSRRAGATPDPAPVLDLERLLRVPSMPAPASDARGGKDRRAWAADFAQARQEVAELERRIRQTQEALREHPSEDWGFTPAGAGTPSDPEVLKRRAELRRDRQSLETARARLRDLEVEASLAGVPDSWTRPEQ